MSYLKDNELLELFELVLTYVARDDIAAKLALFGYDEADRTADQALLEQTRLARKTQQKEYTEARAATVSKEGIKKAAKAAFTQLHRLIKIADKSNPNIDLKRVLQTGRLPSGDAAFLDYTSALLQRVQTDADVVTALGEFGVNAERIAELDSLIQAVRQSNITQNKEKDEAVQATAMYRALIGQVRLAHTIIVQLSKEALAEDPELLKLIEQ